MDYSFNDTSLLMISLNLIIDKGQSNGIFKVYFNMCFNLK